MEAISAVGDRGRGPRRSSGLLAPPPKRERRDRLVQLQKLRIAYQWCVRHPATSESGTATWGDAGLPGLR